MLCDGAAAADAIRKKFARIGSGTRFNAERSVDAIRKKFARIGSGTRVNAERSRRAALVGEMLRTRYW